MKEYFGEKHLSYFSDIIKKLQEINVINYEFGTDPLLESFPHSKKEDKIHKLAEPDDLLQL